MLILGMTVLAAQAKPDNPDYPDYVVENKVLVKYRGHETDVVIPPRLGIDRIGPRAFAGVPVNSVIIPMGVGFIDERAFMGCSFLKTVRLPNTLSTLGRRVFFNCFMLETINIPRSLRSIEDGAFFNCRSLKEMDLPGTLRSLGSRAFSGCAAIQKLSLSRRTTLGQNPFMGVPPQAITWKD
ncbi:hypothetical protein AGMMS50230_03990 [Spirochaetia bacterium]|nr:hypothetical protein AGMMS50230_03990 [Spirochaetia bacterium]